MNSFGRIFKLTTFGESHGKAIGGVVDGMPPGIDIDVGFIQNELNRRRPGQSPIVSQRSENDRINIISGVFEGKSTGAPIAFFVENEDQRSADYDDISTVYRPSHADFTYHKKYGIRDYRGGGRSSARITISRVVAGALAKLVLRRMGITIRAFTKQIGNIELDSDYTQYDIATAENNIVRCPDKEKANQMVELIKSLREEGDTTGGVVGCVIKGCKAGLGEPEFGKLHAALGAAMLSINAAKAFEIGEGWKAARCKGSEMNDVFVASNSISQPIRTATNHSGGIMGGISNGEDIYFNVAFKPIATLSIEQKTCNYEGQPTTIRPNGRHDVCVVPRAVAIVESMAAITLLDYVLLDRAKKNI